MSGFANIGDALDAALCQAPEGPFKVGQRVRRLLRRPVEGVVVKLLPVETDDGRENTYVIQGALVRLDDPDTFRDDYGRLKKIPEVVVDAEDLEDSFWEIVS